jgi:hypothetical protein
MPNWCRNELTITGSHNAIQDFADRMSVHDGSKQIRFADLLPILPNEGWYMWCVNNWGTKWDLDEEQDTEVENTQITSNFQSAWSPPSHWLAHAAATFPLLKFALVYDESGCDFGGELEYEGGVMTSDVHGRSRDNMERELNSVSTLLRDDPYIFAEDLTAAGRLEGDIYSHHYTEEYYAAENDPDGSDDSVTIRIVLNGVDIGGEYELDLGETHEGTLGALSILLHEPRKRHETPALLMEYASEQPDEQSSLHKMMLMKAGGDPLRLQKFAHDAEDRLALYIFN